MYVCIECPEAMTTECERRKWTRVLMYVNRMYIFVCVEGSGSRIL